MKHTELRAAVLDALEKYDTGATLFDGRPAVFDEADFPVELTLNWHQEGTYKMKAKSWTARPGRRSCILKFSCLLRCRIQRWIRGWSPGFIR